MFVHGAKQGDESVERASRMGVRIRPEDVATIRHASQVSNKSMSEILVLGGVRYAEMIVKQVEAATPIRRITDASVVAKPRVPEPPQLVSASPEGFPEEDFQAWLLVRGYEPHKIGSSQAPMLRAKFMQARKAQR